MTQIDFPSKSSDEINSNYYCYSIFLFVNPTSGGNKASIFTKAGMEMFKISDPVSASVYIYDIRDGKKGNKPGFLEVKKITEKSDRNMPVYIIAAGGDGTVMWCVNELEATGINFEYVVIGVIPFGTGNDFSRALNWTTILDNPFDNGLARFRSMIQGWVEAKISEHDIWTITATVDDYGNFYKIDSSSRKKKVVSINNNNNNNQYKDNEINRNNTLNIDIPKTPNIAKKLTFHMSNYFSVGIESRIGIGFDINRTKNASLNKFRYGIEGIKSTLRRTTAVYDLIDKCTVVVDNNETNNKNSNNLGNSPNKEKIIFVTDKTKKYSKNICSCINSSIDNISTNQEIEEFPLTPLSSIIVEDLPILLPCTSLIFINIPSFASGNDIWKYCKGNCGIKCKWKSEEIESMLISKQKMGDGMIECVSFPSAVSIGLEMAIKGNGRRVFQGKGPIKLYFRQKNFHSTCRKVYFQVDGEYVIAYYPLCFEICYKRKIRVLLGNLEKSSNTLSIFKH
ncbi:diacylglycerol kinase catalytic domain-containing family protein [Cryptosporidium andersoni]|uniref:Diacylglycerol kinase n=1 Tax=Cryptosporidium andersoni TaxID=117008 RepID=A0A1J4MQI4_9CRYT|nr:diacylglycerol kinase catalytic domain-containing family protein [Cryptosporidium andersoni]